MKCLLQKGILTVLIIFFLFAGGEEARAYFSNSVDSTADFNVGTLDFNLESGGTARDILEFQYALSGSRALDVVKTGTLPFKYTIGIQNISGDADFCNTLNVSISRDSETNFEGTLVSSISSSVYSEGGNPWVISYESSGGSSGTLCAFDVVFKGWQANVATYGELGFTRDRTVTIVITAPEIPAASAEADANVAAEETVEENGNNAEAQEDGAAEDTAGVPEQKTEAGDESTVEGANDPDAAGAEESVSSLDDGGTAPPDGAVEPEPEAVIEPSGESVGNQSPPLPAPPPEVVTERSPERTEVSSSGGGSFLGEVATPDVSVGSPSEESPSNGTASELVEGVNPSIQPQASAE